MRFDWNGRFGRLGRLLAVSGSASGARWAFGCVGAALLATMAVGCLASGVLLLQAVRAGDLEGAARWLVSALALTGVGYLLARIVGELVRPRSRRQR